MEDKGRAGSPALWRARCFTDQVADQVAGREDAATVSAAGPLAACVSHRLSDGAAEITEGIEMGCPSFLSASRDGDKAVVPGSMQVPGTGTLRLPAGPAGAKGA
ncbi:MAG: hypothetical protein M0Z69_13015 [Actinomycetota bacterium]|nr:hypothetical protein [Actinomycetota bacterium]